MVLVEIGSISAGRATGGAVIEASFAVGVATYAQRVQVEITDSPELDEG